MTEQSASGNAPRTLEEIQIEVLEARGRGEEPTLGAFAARYPEHAADIAEIMLVLWRMDAGDHEPVPGTASATTERVIERTMAGLGQPVDSLADARKAFGWRPDHLADKLHLPVLMVSRLEASSLTDWPALLVSRLSEILGRSQLQVTRLLEHAPRRTPAAAHYSAKGLPEAAIARKRTFREALEECDQLGQLTDEQREEWLETD